MRKVAIVTDSSAYIPPTLLAGLDISVVPQNIHWKNETYLDGITLTTAELAHRLRQGAPIPTTSHASPSVFKEVYLRLINQGFDICSIHVSRNLSGVYNSAMLASAEFNGRVRVVDGESVSMALGFIVLQAARAAARNASIEECLDLVEKNVSKTGAYLLPETLEYLHRGGRIGRAAHLLGTLLKIIPIIEFYKEVQVARRVRTYTQAIDALLDTVENRIAGRWPVRMAFLHVDAYHLLQPLKQKAIDRWGENNFIELCYGEASPTLAIHVGPGAVGITFLAEGK
jgi:DegV family protein with EDD domain